MTSRSTDAEVEFISTKTYCHNVGLSSAFRQWRADSHCRYLHGYALQVTIHFAAMELDVRNWVVDFGSLKGFKGWLEDTFDHKTLVAEDDPKIEYFKQMADEDIIDMMIVPHTGCERFAELIFSCAEIWLKDHGYADRVRVEQVEVREHEANSAIVRRVKHHG